jgi:hypothetical protein
MNKTLKVIPTNNNPSGSYQITLYYTPAEVAGWQTATGQTIANVQLVKVTGQISDVTPSNPSAAGAIVMGAPTIGSMGVNTALTYNFSTGFSGFGAGIPGSAILPLGLLDFSGRLKQNEIALAWTTSFESNTSRFGIERSYDGVHFTNIGYQPAAGNSNKPLDYAFTDPSMPRINNYYRLRQMDLDGKFTYSKTILIDGSSLRNYTVLPSPFTTSLDIIVASAASNPTTPSSPNVTAQTQIRLLDISGKQLLLKNAAPNAGRIHLDVSNLNLTPGIYLLEINNSSVFKVIKQ